MVPWNQTYLDNCLLPIANGLVECFHCPLKVHVALKCQSIPKRWTNSFIMVFLGVRTALNNDLHCSASELVYYTTLCLPAEFFLNSCSNTLDQVTYVTRLKEMMMQLIANPTHHHMRQKPITSSHLSHCIHVFVRQDAYTRLSYHCPHKIVECGAKIFTVDVNGKQEVISLGHLKPAQF